MFAITALRSLISSFQNVSTIDFSPPVVGQRQQAAVTWEAGRAQVQNHEFLFIPFASKRDGDPNIRRFEVFFTKLANIKSGKVVILVRSPRAAKWISRDLLVIMHELQDDVKINYAMSDSNYVDRNIAVQLWTRQPDETIAILFTDSIGTATLEFEKAPYLFNFDIPEAARREHAYAYFRRVDKLTKEGKIKHAITFIDPSMDDEHDMAVDLAEKYWMSPEFERAGVVAVGTATEVAVKREEDY